MSDSCCQTIDVQSRSPCRKFLGDLDPVETDLGKRVEEGDVLPPRPRRVDDRLSTHLAGKSDSEQVHRAVKVSLERINEFETQAVAVVDSRGRRDWPIADGIASRSFHRLPTKL